MVLLGLPAVRAVWPALVTHWLKMEVTCVTSRPKHVIDGGRLPRLSVSSAAVLEKDLCKDGGAKTWKGLRSLGHHMEYGCPKESYGPGVDLHE